TNSRTFVRRPNLDSRRFRKGPAARSVRFSTTSSARNTMNFVKSAVVREMPTKTPIRRIPIRTTAIPIRIVGPGLISFKSYKSLFTEDQFNADAESANTISHTADRLGDFRPVCESQREGDGYLGFNHARRSGEALPG